MEKKTCVLCVLDGWGEGPATPYNAVSQARTPHWTRLKSTYPWTVLDASEEAVGLPRTQMGNSEVGHMTLGAGRVIFQDLPRIDQAIKTQALSTHPVLKDAVASLKEREKKCHVMGLLSPGGVHSHTDHIVFMLRFLASQDIPVIFHGFLDGRDTPPQSAYEFMKDFLGVLETLPQVTMGTLSGRYYAMDRDNRWDRTEKAYAAIVRGDGFPMSDPLEAMKASYAQGVNDEFMVPLVMEGYQGCDQGEGLVMTNFRADRVRQLLSALVLEEFKGFKRHPIPFDPCIGMMHYGDVFSSHLKTLFPSQEIAHSLGEVLSQRGMTQLRIAETEKYAHVTFFFNGGREEPFPGESRILVPSPKVATYDLAPEMSASLITEHVVEAIEKNLYDLIIVNYANTDMVGHTGNLEATLKAVETVDECLGRLEDAILKTQGLLCITADHGNAEMMWDAHTQGPHTAHTCYKVPLILAGKALTFKKLAPGSLADVAPTLLSVLGVPRPCEMTGHTLICDS